MLVFWSLAPRPHSIQPSWPRAFRRFLELDNVAGGGEEVKC